MNTSENPSVYAGPSWVIQLIQASQGKLKYSYLPYSVGLLQAYCMRYAGDLRRYTFLPLLTGRSPLAEVLPRIQLADVYGFSTYVWNINYSLALAAEIKARKPQALVIFGGPQVPDRAEDFLRAHPWVDVCVHGEGERVFLQLLESLPARDWDQIPGISWIDADGQFHHCAPGPRILDLDTIPSPYLMGIFDSLMGKPQAGGPETEWVPLWETNRGCPFSCTFCDWGSNIGSKLQRFGMERLRAEIDWFAAHRIEIVNCNDANFGILPRDLEIADYMIETFQRTGFPRSFYIQSSKNATDRVYAVQKRIVQSGLYFIVTLSLQSVTPQVLTSIRRENISLDTFRQLQHRFRRDGVPTYTDLLIGLPGETYDSFADGICRVIAEGQHNWINFYNVFLLPNAEMAQPEYRSRHGIRSVSTLYSEAGLQMQQLVPEALEMVTSTDSLSPDDWYRSRTFAWWVQILYFYYKLLQVPLLTLHALGGVAWRELFEFFSEARFTGTPMLQDLHRFLNEKARRMARGEPEHCFLSQLHEPYWMMVPKYIVAGLASEPVARAFFAEIGQALRQLQAAHTAVLPAGLLNEALQLSEGLFLAPVLQKPFTLPGRYGLWAWYQAWLCGEPIELQPEACRYVRDTVTEHRFNLRVENVSSFGLTI
ncbi:MAG: radical SAM protein [Candidatus Sericytochromatia bacterium]